jgi:hypothetical protein
MERRVVGLRGLSRSYGTRQIGHGDSGESKRRGADLMSCNVADHLGDDALESPADATTTACCTQASPRLRGFEPLGGASLARLVSDDASADREPRIFLRLPTPTQAGLTVPILVGGG